MKRLQYWRLRVGLLLIACMAACLAGLVVKPAVAANDTTFYAGRELGARLLNNIVKIRSQEHGFGLVVSAAAGFVYIATARHVLEPAVLPGQPVAPSPPIEVDFCGNAASGAASRAATRVVNFDAGGHDLALLRVAQPAGYEPLTRVVAPEAESSVGQETWLLGQSQQCGVMPRSGAIAVLPNSRGDMRIEYPGALGGHSGGPAISGYGVLGLITDASDLTFTIHSITSLQARLRGQSAAWWQLAPARNIPLTDPRSAQIDLSETLNLYLFGVRNLQKLLQQPVVPKELFKEFASDYNLAVNRFRLARERHDATLKSQWPEGILANWETLREQLWQVHQSFWQMNDGDSQRIFDQQVAPPAVQKLMRELEPALVQLDVGIKVFLKTLTQGAKP